MKTLLKLTYFVGCFSIPFCVFANNVSATNASSEAKMEKMEQQIESLQGQLTELTRELKNNKVQHHYAAKQSKNHMYLYSKTYQKNAPVYPAANSVKGAKAGAIGRHRTYKDFDQVVMIGPYTERPTYNTGSQLVVNTPSINQDARLLLRRKAEEDQLIKAGLPLATQPRMVLSGKISAKGTYYRPYHGASSSDIDVSGVNFDSFLEVSPWVNGFMSFAYDGTAPSASPRRMTNSNIYLDKAFITIGNFNKSPFYGSVGQMYVPFGRYSSNMISDPLTSYVGKAKARGIVLNYAPNKDITPYARVFLFKGDSKYGNSNIAKQYGVDVGYRYNEFGVKSNFGASYIANIADSNGMQNTGMANSSFFRGFDKSNVEQLVHNVPGIDLHGVLGHGPFNLLGEYVTAMTQFSQNDITYNTHGAKPSAFNVEGSYVFKMWKHPGSFAVGYARSNQSLALNIPKQRYIAALTMTVLRNTTAQLELRHDINYGRNDRASGQTMTAFTQNELGKSDTGLAAELSVFY